MENNNPWLSVAIFVIVILSFSNYSISEKLDSSIKENDSLIETISEKDSEIDGLYGEIVDNEDLISNLRDERDELNMAINNAKDYTWGTYHEMGYALDNLSTSEEY